jgi:putative chitinase
MLFGSSDLGAQRLLRFPEHVAEDPYLAASVSADYWRRNGLNELADAGKFRQIGNVINTGRAESEAHGTPERLARTDVALEALA